MGVDVSKGKSEACILLRKGTPFGQPFRFEHTAGGFADLQMQLQAVEDATRERPAIILEATGHYHGAVVEFLQRQGYPVIVINPLVAKRARTTQLRKVKTDAADARLLAELYFREEFSPLDPRNVQVANLRHLTRQHEAVTTQYVQAKLHFRAILDQLFPLYEGIFSDIYAATSLQFLKQYPTPAAVLAAGPETVGAAIHEHNHQARSAAWAQRKADHLLEVARNSPSLPALEPSLRVTLTLWIDLLLQYHAHLQALAAQIETAAREIPAYRLLLTIPGVGAKLAAAICAEIGDIQQFADAKKLVAFAGVDPSIFASGKFAATDNHITKRGSKGLRRALFLAVQCGLRRTSPNDRIRAFYEKKRHEGKAHKVACIAAVNKLLHIIFAVLRHGEGYRPQPATP